ncbi:MAG TPA: ISL3 family transposase, partial [Segeticoccus sp.]|uniref:ISL3 family transposase n=1 Tax=Segeticoccus sp. TaxID=2706531 RepID=UPI002D803939
MQNATLWRALLGVERTVIEDVELVEDEQVLIAHVRPKKGARGRCGRCQRRAPWYDHGEGRRRWRGLDLGLVRVWLEADAPRVSCPEHGPTVVAVPWARHGAGHTHDFDAQVAWLATHCSKTTVTELMRIAWRTVGSIIARVWAEVEAVHDRFSQVRRIGIDEISYRRGHKYLTVVVDHDSGHLLWAAPGRDKATVHRFFDALGPERCARITHVSADGADWISAVVAQRCPTAVRCADPFHIVKWATEALDEVRRQAWNEARGAVGRRRAGRASGHAKALKHARFALWKNPQNLTERQQAKLAWVAKADPRLYRAYLLKEHLRMVFQLDVDEAAEALDVWIGWARRCRIPAFVELQRRIVKHADSILAAIEHGLSNGRIESV